MEGKKKERKQAEDEHGGGGGGEGGLEDRMSEGGKEGTARKQVRHDGGREEKRRMTD